MKARLCTLHLTRPCWPPGYLSVQRPFNFLIMYFIHMLPVHSAFLGKLCLFAKGDCDFILYLSFTRSTFTRSTFTRSMMTNEPAQNTDTVVYLTIIFNKQFEVKRNWGKWKMGRVSKNVMKHYR